MGGFLASSGGSTPLVVARDMTQTAIMGGTANQLFPSVIPLALPALPATQMFRVSVGFFLAGLTGNSFQVGFQITDHGGAIAAVSAIYATVKLGSPSFGSNWYQGLIQNLNSQSSQYFVSVGQQTFPANNAGLATAPAELTQASTETLDLSRPSTGQVLINTTNNVPGGTYYFSMVELL